MLPSYYDYYEKFLLDNSFSQERLKRLNETDTKPCFHAL